jgi:predicted DNA-binding transcriptional regulator YafY
MTLKEISDAWSNAASNLDQTELSARTFHRYREEIAADFGIEIKCDKSNGYQYYISRNSYLSSEITDWMLSSLRIASLGDMLKYHDRVMLENPPANTEMLDDILCAIDKHYLLSFHYSNPYGNEWDMKLAPAFVRLFHQRWYVIGNLIVEGKPDEYRPRILAFDRISQLEICCKAYPLSKDIRRKFAPEMFYRNCFGIIRQSEIPVEDIVIRAFYPQNNYINEVPLHESQTKISDCGEYTDYRLHLSPTTDFLQELLWHGRKITVLSPESLRLKMQSIVKDMAESYATGKNTMEE